MSAFLATMRMCVKKQSYFGLSDLLGEYALRLAQLIALIALWRALFSRGTVIDGMTAEQMIRYTVLSSALYPLLNVRTPASGWLHDGTVLGLYERPAPVLSQLISHTMGGWVAPLFLFGAPVLVIAALFGLPARPENHWFYLSLPLATAEGFAVDFLFACLLIRMRGLEWTVYSIREALSALLTGALIPFQALPFGIGDALALSPLGTLAGASLSLYAGLGDPAKLIPAQIFWTVTLSILASVCFKRSSERMISYGG